MSVEMGVSCGDGQEVFIPGHCGLHLTLLQSLSKLAVRLLQRLSGLKQLPVSLFKSGHEEGEVEGEREK